MHFLNAWILSPTFCCYFPTISVFFLETRSIFHPFIHSENTNCVPTNSIQGTGVQVANKAMNKTNRTGKEISAH